MSVPIDIARRRLLMALAASVPAVRLLGPGTARAADSGADSGTDSGADDDAFLRISRSITGSDALSADVARRIRGLLADRIDGFDARLDELDRAMRAAGQGRKAMLAALDDAQVGFALDIAKPWYLGYVGTPSDTILKDDAQFATFLEAQAWQKIIAEVPRQTYPGKAGGWWSAVPPGVDAPAMPERILDWTFHPGGPSGPLAPDPVWRAYASADHASIDAARRARPGGSGAPKPGGAKR